MKKAVCIATFLCVLTIGNTGLNTGIEATVIKTPCQPFSSLFLWHIGTGKDSVLYQQRRILILSIMKFPENTTVRIVTFGADNDITLNFTKQAGVTQWIYPITQNITAINTPNEAISNIEIDQIVSSYYKSHDSNKAEIIYILGHDTTVINAADRKKKTFVILTATEKQTTNKINEWLKLASDKHHFIESNKEEDINKTVETIVSLSCKDSMFVCDTDMYWWMEKGICNVCTFICTKSCTEQPEFCSRECPYFHQQESDLNATKCTDDNTESLHEENGCVSRTALGIIIFIAVIEIPVTVIVIKKRRTLLRYINALRKKVNGSKENVSFLPVRKKDNGSRDRSYISKKNDTDFSKRPGESREDLDLKVFST